MSDYKPVETYDRYGLIFNDSFERVLGVDSDRDHFFDLFYEIFMNSSEEIRSKFTNTDMAKQKSILRSSLYNMMHFFATKESGTYLKELAEMHNRSNRDIKPEFYDVWLEAMIETIKECDAKFSESVEVAWRVVLAPGITYMKFYYDH